MSNDEVNGEFVQIFLEECGDILADWERHCLGLEQSPTPERLSALFRAAHNLKGSARSVGLNEFAKLIHKAEDLITLLRDGHVHPDKNIVAALLSAQSLLLSWSEELRRNTAFVPVEQRDALEVLLKQLNNKKAEAVTATPAFGMFDENPIPPGPASLSFASAKSNSDGAGGGERRENDSHEVIRVPAAKIDTLMQIIGELSTQQSTIMHCLKSGTMGEKICHNAVQIASKLTRELQLQTMGLRLIDLSRLFQRLERAARDVASGQGKDVSIELSGAEVELDKTVIERMTDALTHMVRNAIDHGIEAPDQRGEKPKTAVLRLSAFQTAGGVSIEVSDDGRGIDTKRVLEKAIQKGLATVGKDLPPEKIYDFLFAPGFSTAAAITEVSGRGVGLDVVKRTIDQLGGSLTTSSVLGQGTRFILSLPTSVSIIDSLIILTNGMQYVVPIQEISEVIDMRACTVQTSNSQSRTILLREKAVNVRRLGAHLPLTRDMRKTEAPAAGSNPEPAMIVEVDGQRLGFAVDRVIGQQPIVIRKLGVYVAHIPGFSGSTVLANGEPAIILSPKTFARQYFSMQEVS